MATKKTLYHSELAKAGKTTIDVISDLVGSKHKAGTFIVFLKFNGEDRTYQVENDACAASLRDRKGQRLAIEAGGARETASIAIHEAVWIEAAGEAQPPQAAPTPVAPKPAAAPRPDPGAAPRPAAPAAQAAPAAPAPAKASVPPGGALKAELFRLANCEINVQCITAKVAAELETKRGIVLTPEQRLGIAGRLFIGVTRDRLHASLPGDRLIDCTPHAVAVSDNDGGAA